VALAIQKVELIGGESWWSHNSGSLFIGLAAIIAAGLAAYISIRNHKQQLAHDREIRDRDATRNAIENAVEGIANLVLKVVIFSAQVDRIEKSRRPVEKTDSEGEGQSSERQEEIAGILTATKKALPEIHAATNRMHANTFLLAIRLGKNHSITTAHAKTQRALKQWFLNVNRGRSKNRDEAQRKEMDDLVSEVGASREKFESACFNWINERS
jgi:hypothetical protein